MNKLNEIINTNIISKWMNILNIDKNEIEILIKLMKFENIPKNKILFKESQKSDSKIYIILEGTVGVAKFLNKEYIHDKKIINIDNIYIGHFIRKLFKGEIFGQLALNNKENRRTSSIYTIENTKFLVINKIDFDIKINKKLNKDFYQKKELFLKIFNNKISNHLFEMIVFMSKKIEFKHGKVLISQNQIYKKLYIIYDGILEFYKTNNHLKYINKKYYIKQLSYYQIFGEEIFFSNNPKSNYNIYVKSSKVILYTIDLEEINKYPEMKFFLKNYFSKLSKARSILNKEKESKMLKNIYKINNKSLNLEGNQLNKYNKITSYLNKNNKYIIKRNYKSKTKLKKIILFQSKKKTKENKIENYLINNSKIINYSFIQDSVVKNILRSKVKNKHKSYHNLLK